MKKTIRRTTAGLLSAMTVLSAASVMPVFAAENSRDGFNVIVTREQENSANQSTIERVSGGRIKSKDIDDLIHSLDSKGIVNITDKQFRNLIAGKTGIKAEEITDKVLATIAQKLEDTEYFKACKSKYILPGVGVNSNRSVIYPGNIVIQSESNIVSGKHQGIVIGREENATVKVNGKTVVNIPSFNPASKPYDVILQNINNKALVPDGERNYNIRIASATSPIQLSASLGVTTDALSKIISEDTWKKIQSGEKQVSVVSVQQPICTVEYSIDLSHPSNMFSDKTTKEELKKLLGADGSTNAMLIKKVTYGRQYLMLAELNLNCTPLEMKPDLTNGLIEFFRGGNATTGDRTSALKYAKITALEMGVGSDSWKVSKREYQGKKYDITSPSQFLDYLGTTKKYTADGSLVPISYEAVNIGGAMSSVKLSYNTSEYNFKGIKADKINNLSFNDWAKGSNIHGDLAAYGIDINEFNNTGKIVEKKYSYGRGTHTIPAYQQLFGLELNLEAGETGSSGNIKITSDGRIYSNALVNITNDNGYNETGRLDLNNAQLDLDKHDPGAFCKYHNKLHTKLTLKNDDNTSRTFDHWSWAADDRTIGYGSAWATLKYVAKYDINGEGLKVNNTDNGCAFKD